MRYFAPFEGKYTQKLEKRKFFPKKQKFINYVIPARI
jgi:hypothetical protein